MDLERVVVLIPAAQLFLAHEALHIVHVLLARLEEESRIGESLWTGNEVLRMWPTFMSVLSLRLFKE